MTLADDEDLDAPRAGAGHVTDPGVVVMADPGWAVLSVPDHDRVFTVGRDGSVVLSAADDDDRMDR